MIADVWMALPRRAAMPPPRNHALLLL